MTTTAPPTAPVTAPKEGFIEKVKQDVEEGARLIGKDLPSDFREARAVANFAGEVVGVVDPALSPFITRIEGVLAKTATLRTEVAKLLEDFTHHATGTTPTAPTASTVSSVTTPSAPVSTTEPTPSTVTTPVVTKTTTSPTVPVAAVPAPSTSDAIAALVTADVKADLLADETPAPPAGFTATPPQATTNPTQDPTKESNVSNPPAGGTGLGAVAP